MSNILYNGWLTVLKRVVNDRQYEVIRLRPAAAAIILNESEDQILLVRQFRPSIMKEIWEIPAGIMDVQGECAVECIARELQEEAEISINKEDLVRLTGYYAMIGCSNHYLDIYLGTA